MADQAETDGNAPFQLGLLIGQRKVRSFDDHLLEKLQPVDILLN